MKSGTRLTFPFPAQIHNSRRFPDPLCVCSLSGPCCLMSISECVYSVCVCAYACSRPIAEQNPQVAIWLARWKQQADFLPPDVDSQRRHSAGNMHRAAARAHTSWKTGFGSGPLSDSFRTQNAVVSTQRSYAAEKRTRAATCKR